MNLVTGITSQPKQVFAIVLEDGSRVSGYLEYRPQQIGWFLNLARGTWSVNGLRVVSTPNLLKQWQRTIGFGLAVITAGDVEPLNLTDFANGTSKLYTLNAADIAAVNAAAYKGN